MSRDPLAGMADAPLFVVPRVLDALHAFRPCFEDLRDEESARLAAEFDRLLGRLCEGIERHPTRFWVMRQFQRSLEAIGSEDRPARRQAARALETLMAILGIDDPAGLVEHYLGWP